MQVSAYLHADERLSPRGRGLTGVRVSVYTPDFCRAQLIVILLVILCCLVELAKNSEALA